MTTTTIRTTAIVENKINHKEKDNANEAIIVSITDKIKDGNKLHEEKLKNNLNKATIIEPLNKEKLIKRHNCRKMMIGKFYYPKENKYKGCMHSGAQKIPKRDCLSRDDYDKLLSQPKRKIITNNEIKYVQKPIYNASNRLVKLAQPKLVNIFNMYQDFAEYFDDSHLKTIALTVKNLNYTNIPTALNTFAENKDFKKCKNVIKKKNQIMAKKKYIKLQEKYLNNLLENMFESRKLYLLCAASNFTKPSVVTNKQFCRLRGIFLKKLSNYTNWTDHFTVELADKFAHWLCYMVGESNYPISASCCDLNEISEEKLSIPSSDLLPIDHYINYSAESNNIFDDSNGNQLLTEQLSEIKSLAEDVIGNNNQTLDSIEKQGSSANVEEISMKKSKDVIEKPPKSSKEENIVTETTTAENAKNESQNVVNNEIPIATNENDTAGLEKADEIATNVVTNDD